MCNSIFRYAIVDFDLPTNTIKFYVKYSKCTQDSSVLMLKLFKPWQYIYHVYFLVLQPSKTYV